MKIAQILECAIREVRMFNKHKLAGFQQTNQSANRCGQCIISRLLIQIRYLNHLSLILFFFGLRFIVSEELDPIWNNFLAFFS